MELDNSLDICFKIDWESGRMVQVTTNSQALNHFLDYIKLTRAYHTWVNYAHDLKSFFAVVGKRPADVTRSDCLEFLKRQVDDGYANTTINRRLATLTSLFDELHAFSPERYPRNPLSAQDRARHNLYRKQPKRLPKIVPIEGIRHLFKCLPTLRDRTLVLLMWLSCLRVSEAVNIRFQDIECGRRSIHIPQSKGNKNRIVYMDAPTFAFLNRYLDEERGVLFPEVEQVFVAFKGKARGRPLSVSAVQKMVRYYGRRVGLPRLHPHLFRHTGITQLLEQGMPEPVIRQFVGHSHPDSLQPYLHFSDEFVLQEFERTQSGLDPTSWELPGDEQ